VAPTQEARVEVLEVMQTLEEKVENLETNAGPGRAEAQSGNLAELRRQFAEFGEVQARQTRTLDIHTAKFSAIERASDEAKLAIHLVKSEIKQVREEFSGKFERLESEFGWLRGQFTDDGGLLVGLSRDMLSIKDGVMVLKTDVAVLKTNVAGLKTDVAVLKTDVAELKTDVAVLKTDVAELKTDVAVLKTDVAELKTDVALLKTDVAVLKTDVAELKGGVSELKTDMADVKGSLKEILDRLPAKAA
jgi:FtsZ-binding cell division protein ZapB